MHFKFQPLFHALCIVIDEPTEKTTEQIVRLVSSGINKSGQCEPISLKCIGDGDTRHEISGGNVVTTDCLRQ